VDPAQFRELLGRFATGVTVITLNGSDGRPQGMTASSLASVSLQPPLVSVCIDLRAELHGAIVAAEEFVVNILESEQEALSRRFAEPHPDRFAGVGYQRTPDGLVRLESALAHIECARHGTFQGGDHTIVLGLVIGGGTSDGRPLLYYRGGYSALE
jgi:flavin reductase (DIM6/NTAB) family NADH-FMN oxidoreductase RutF